MLSVTNIIIGITVLFSMIGFSKPAYLYKYSYNPSQIITTKQYYRFITHAFLHSDWMHLFFNIYVLYSFGNLCEQTLVILFGSIKGSYYLIFIIFFWNTFLRTSSHEKK